MNNHIRHADPEVKIGRIRGRQAGELADDCLKVIQQKGRVMAVTVSPCGWVWVEPVESAAECDMLGAWGVPADLQAYCEAKASLRECLMDERRIAA